MFKQTLGSYHFDILLTATSFKLLAERQALSLVMPFLYPEALDTATKDPERRSSLYSQASDLPADPGVRAFKQLESGFFGFR